MRYQLLRSGVLDLPNERCIPEDCGNHDWQEYLAWVDAGNKPAEPPPEPAPGPDYVRAAIAVICQMAAEKGQWQPSEIADKELRDKIAEWQNELLRPGRALAEREG